MALLDAKYRWCLTGTPVTNVLAHLLSDTPISNKECSLFEPQSLADLYGLTRFVSKFSCSSMLVAQYLGLVRTQSLE